MTSFSGLDSSLLSLLSMMRSNSDEIDTVSKRLSTGKRVNSAQDDPEAFFRSEGYKGRATDLLKLNADTSVTSRALKSAKGAFDSIKQQLESLSKTLSDALDTKVDALATRAVSTIGYAGTSASLVGSGATRFNEGDVLSVAVGTNGSKIYFRTTTGAPAGGGALPGGAAGTLGNPIAVGTVQDLITQLGKLTFADGTNSHTVTAALDGGQLSLTTDDTMRITLESNGSGTPVNDLGQMFSGLSSSTKGTSTSTVTFDPTTASASALKQREDAYKSYVSAMRQIDLLARDSGISQVDNMLLGDGAGGGARLNVRLSDGDASGFDIGFSTASDAMGLGLAASYWSRFGKDTDLQGALDSVTRALETVGARIRTTVSNQQLVDNRIAFNKDLADILNGAAGDLTAADLDVETVRLASLQSNRQAAIKMLGIRMDTTQSLLKLL